MKKVKRWFMYLQIRVQTHVTSVLYYQFMLLQSGKKRSKDKKQIGYKQGGQLRQTIPDFLSCVFRHTTMRDWFSIRKS
jgi:hypothetical protein